MPDEPFRYHLVSDIKGGVGTYGLCPYTTHSHYVNSAMHNARLVTIPSEYDEQEKTGKAEFKIGIGAGFPN